MRFIHFYFQLVEKFEHAQTFQLIGINCWFDGNSEFSSYKIELRKMTSLFELPTRIFLQKFFFRFTNSTLWNIKLHFELLAHSQLILEIQFSLCSVPILYWFCFSAFVF